MRKCLGGCESIRYSMLAYQTDTVHFLGPAISVKNDEGMLSVVMLPSLPSRAENDVGV